MSTNSASLEAPLSGTLWVIQVLGATLLLISGSAKLSGDETTLRLIWRNDPNSVREATNAFSEVS